METRSQTSREEKKGREMKGNEREKSDPAAKEGQLIPQTNEEERWWSPSLKTSTHEDSWACSCSEKKERRKSTLDFLVEWLFWLSSKTHLPCLYASYSNDSTIPADIIGKREMRWDEKEWEGRVWDRKRRSRRKRWSIQIIVPLFSLCLAGAINAFIHLPHHQLNGEEWGKRKGQEMKEENSKWHSRWKHGERRRRMGWDVRCLSSERESQGCVIPLRV